MASQGRSAIRRRIEVSGVVQGVGFRPYVYRLATDRRLTGNILNTSAGVTIEVEGAPVAVHDFITRLPNDAPRLAHITSVTVEEVPFIGEHDFQILASRGGEEPRVLISPDVAICDDCLRELFDPGDRRYRYPFINCTNCGPRYTIVRDIPYDRRFTSMAAFPMCPACEGEYQDPFDRRFHAQPNACWKCGPQVELWDADGHPLKLDNPIATTATWLQEGAIVAIKGLGGFHLAVDATNSEAVDHLRTCKRRVEKPLAVMVPDLEAARRFCEIDDLSSRTLTSAQRPIVLLPRKPGGTIVDSVAPRNRYLGLFLPYTPIQYLLFDAGKFEALVMTSANLSEEPIAIDNSEAVTRLHGIADFFLVHNRDILIRKDDSVVRASNGKLRQMRRSRGYVPIPIFLHKELPKVLAVGGELKNTICFGSGKNAFLSQHIGDLENLESYGFFEETVHHMRRILELDPQAIACDLHPDYFSSRWAQQQSLPLVEVQHHHAHIAACMAENHLEERIIGVALDGTGYGTDGNIWGGEILLANYEGFERVAHLEYVALPGGEAAIREPWRIAVSYLWQHFGRGFLDFSLPFLREIEPGKVELLLEMLENRLNSPLSSGCGRLFDGVAALLGIRSKVSYEGQAAIELEMLIDGTAGDTFYPFSTRDENGMTILATRPLFEAILSDLRNSVRLSAISRRFHDGLAEALASVIRRLGEQTGLRQVCLSGGCFQNVYLSEKLERILTNSNFQVLTHSQVPAGDGGISLGQALVAAAQLQKATVAE
jgi:hydrogenase maturation protein HypF